MISYSQHILDVFQWLIRSSFQATILLGIILLIRIVVKRKFRFRMVYWLWMLLLLRLIWPLNVQTAYSVFNLIPRQAEPAHYLSTPAAEEPTPSIPSNAANHPMTVTPSELAVSEQESSSPTPTLPVAAAPKAASFDWQGLLCTVWLVGVILIGSYVLFCNFRLWRIVTSQRLITRQGILELLEDCKAQLGLQTVIGIVETDKVKTPCLFGYLRPRLLLPAGALDELSAEQLRYVFIHELAHLKRHDIFIGWLMAAVQTLHWFNPAVWFAMAQINADRELACDELALSTLKENEPQAYGSTILTFLERFAHQQKLPAMAGIAENQSLAKRRITMIATFKNKKASLIPVLPILVLLAATTFTSARSIELTPVLQAEAQPTASVDSLSTATDLQAMIDAAEPGTTVKIPAGTYDKPIRITKSLRLIGDDADSVIKVTANEPAIMIDTKGQGKVQIEKLIIQWQLASSDKQEMPFAVAVKDTEGYIQNCIFRPLGNPKRSPVAIRSMGFSGMYLNACDFTGFDYVVCYGEGTKGVMTDCFIRNCGHQGVILYRGAEAKILHNIITGSRYHAVRTTGGKLTMKDNLIINNKNRGVYLGNRSGSGVIENNLLIGNGTGIDGMSACRFKVINNVILKSSYSAISARPYAMLGVQGNVLADNVRGIIVHQDEGKTDPVKSKFGKNIFWKNQTDTENCEGGDKVVQEPDFIEPGNGNFKLADLAFEDMGLRDPKVIFDLWQKYKENK